MKRLDMDEVIWAEGCPFDHECERPGCAPELCPEAWHYPRDKDGNMDLRRVCNLGCVLGELGCTAGMPYDLEVHCHYFHKLGEGIEFGCSVCIQAAAMADGNVVFLRDYRHKRSLE